MNLSFQQGWLDMTTNLKGLHPKPVVNAVVLASVLNARELNANKSVLNARKLAAADVKPIPLKKHNPKKNINATCYIE